MVPHEPVVTQSPVITIVLTQSLGSAAHPLNLIDSAFDNTSNLGSNGGIGICSVHAPHPHPIW